MLLKIVRLDSWCPFKLGDFPSIDIYSSPGASLHRNSEEFEGKSLDLPPLGLPLDLGDDLFRIHGRACSPGRSLTATTTFATWGRSGSHDKPWQKMGRWSESIWIPYSVAISGHVLAPWWWQKSGGHVLWWYCLNSQSLDQPWLRWLVYWFGALAFQDIGPPSDG